MAKISAPALKNLASGVKGKPYSQGPWGAPKYRSNEIIPNGPLAGKKRGPREGHGIWGDCSSSVAVLVNYVSGRDPWAGNRFSTHTMGNVLPGRGFVKGRGGAGTLRVSWGNGHTVARLPDGTDFEMTPNYGLFGSVRNKVEKYSNAYYMPAANFTGVAGGGAAATPQTTTASGSVTVTASALNVRAGAGTNYRVLGVLKKGQTASVTGAQGSWLKISYGGGSGWVSKQYTKAGAAAASKPAAPKPAAARKVTVTASALNVRSGAGTSYRILGSLKKGQSVSVTAEQSGWLKIAYGSSGGWISKQYTKAGASSSGGSSAPAAPATKKATVTTDVLNVRAGAGTNNRVVGTVKRGQSLTVSSESNGWLKISAGSISGWVSKQYTSLGSSGGGGASSGGGAAAKGKAAKVISIARSHIGSKKWPNLCQAFVSDMFIKAGINNVRRASAKAAEASWGGKKGNPPAGAAVYMSSSTTAGKKYGHVGIATGNGLTIVHSAGGVRESSANSSWSKYTSWGWHGGTKLS